MRSLFLTQGNWIGRKDGKKGRFSLAALGRRFTTASSSFFCEHWLLTRLLHFCFVVEITTSSRYFETPIATGSRNVFSIPRSMPSENWLCSLLQSDLNFEQFYLTQVLRSPGFTDQQWNKRTISPVFHTQINVIGAFWINVFGWQIAKCLPFFSESHARIRPRDPSAAHSVDDRLLRETLFSCLLKRWLIFVAHLCLWFLLLYSLMPQFNLLIIY